MGFIDGYVKSPLAGIAPWVLLSIVSGPGRLEEAASAAKKAILDKFKAAANDPRIAERQAERVAIAEAREVRMAEREAAKKAREAELAAHLLHLRR